MTDANKPERIRFVRAAILLWISGTYSLARYSLRIYFLPVILLVFIAFYFFRAKGIPLDDVQTIFYLCFLLSLIGLFRVPLPKLSRLNASFYILFPCILIAAPSFFILNIRGYLPNSPFYRGGFVARLSEGKTPINARSLVFKVNEVNYLYNIPILQMLQRQFNTSLEAHNWVTSRPQTSFLLWGKGAWPTLELQGTALISKDFLPPPLSEPGTRCGLGGRKNALTLHVGNISPVALCFIISPERFAVPFSDMELGRHFLAFFSQGLSRLGAKLDAVPQLYTKSPTEWLRLPFAQASEIFGPWPNQTPLGAARFFIANSELLNALTEEDPSPSQLDCALSEYRKAASSTHIKNSPELTSAIFNNAAIAMLLRATESNDFEKAKNWFVRAARERTPDGERVAGALSALENLHFLTSSGIL